MHPVQASTTPDQHQPTMSPTRIQGRLLAVGSGTLIKGRAVSLTRILDRELDGLAEAEAILAQQALQF